MMAVVMLHLYNITYHIIYMILVIGYVITGMCGIFTSLKKTVI